jgi:hypothetical protein
MVAPSFLPGLQRVAARAAPARPGVRVLPGLQRGGGAPCVGTLTVSGVVSRLTTPEGGLIVRLHERASGRLVRSTNSAPDGSYSFASLSAAFRYYVVLLDPLEADDAAVADLITPE